MITIRGKQYTWRDLLGPTIGLAVLISLGIYSFGQWVEYSLRTEEVYAEVIHEITYRQTIIDKFTAVRKVNQRSVDGCAHDIYKEYECDKYKQICTAEETTCVKSEIRVSAGDTTEVCVKTRTDCVSWKNGDCVEGHWEYDYNIREWRSFKRWTAEFWNQEPNELDLKKYDLPNFNVKTTYSRVIVVKKDGQTKHLDVSVFPKNTHIRVKRRVKSKKILSLIKV